MKEETVGMSLSRMDEYVDRKKDHYLAGRSGDDTYYPEKAGVSQHGHSSVYQHHTQKDGCPHLHPRC